MERAPVELKVGGQTYRVVASAAEADLRRLADVVDSRLRALTAPGRGMSPQTLLLAAISLAHDLEERERYRRSRIDRARCHYASRAHDARERGRRSVERLRIRLSQQPITCPRRRRPRSASYTNTNGSAKIRPRFMRRSRSRFTAVAEPVMDPAISPPP
jgi:cell division protein ZapA